jgi:hypothetical protein
MGPSVSETVFSQHWTATAGGSQARPDMARSQLPGVAAMRQSAAHKDGNMEDEEYMALSAITKQQMVKKQQTEKTYWML